MALLPVKGLIFFDSSKNLKCISVTTKFENWMTCACNFICHQDEVIEM